MDIKLDISIKTFFGLNSKPWDKAMQLQSLVCGWISEWFESGLHVTLHVKKTNAWRRNFTNHFYVNSGKKIPPPQHSGSCGDATSIWPLPFVRFASKKWTFVHFIFILFCCFLFCFILFLADKAAEIRTNQNNKQEQQESHVVSAAGPGKEEELQST